MDETAEKIELALLRVADKYGAFETTDHANHIAHQLVSVALREVAENISELCTK